MPKKRPPGSEDPNRQQRRWIPARGQKWWPDSWKSWKDKQPMRTRRGLVQKPWNKPSRAEKFWAVPTQGSGGNSYYITVSNSAFWVVNVSGYELSATGLVASAAGTNSALGHCKVHRIQGHIWAWLDPTDQEVLRGAVAQESSIGTGTDAKDQGDYIHSNIAMVNYVWLKLKTDANTPTEGGTMGAPADLNPHPTNDLTQLLVRDDIIGWGTVPVFGIIPRMWTQFPHPGVVGQVENIMWNSMPAQYLQQHVAKIPVPRMPKMGLNLRRGERLVCAVAQIPGPGGDAAAVIDDAAQRGVVIWPNLRYFCSL